MNRAEALELAREVMSGKARSLVGAAHALSQFLIEEEARRSSPTLHENPAVGLALPRQTLPFIPEAPRVPSFEKQIEPVTAKRPLPPAIPPDEPTRVQDTPKGDRDHECG